MTRLPRRLPRIERGCLAVLLHDIGSVVAKAPEPLWAVRAGIAQQERVGVLPLLVYEVHHLSDVPVLIVVARLEVCVIGVLELEHVRFVVAMLFGVVEVAEVAGGVALRAHWHNRNWTVQRSDKLLDLLE